MLGKTTTKLTQKNIKALIILKIIFESERKAKFK